MPNPHTPDILVIGGAHIDRVGRSHARLEPGQSNPGSLKKNIGGVAGNIARSLSKLDRAVALSTILGEDSDADWVREQLELDAIDIAAITSDATRPTANYTAIEDKNGAMLAAIADMAIYDLYLEANISQCLSRFPQTPFLMADTNLPEAALAALAEQKGERTLALCAVSGPKANRAGDILSDIDLLFCNEAEAAILAQEFAELEAVPDILREEGVKNGVITKGDAGVTAWSGDEVWQFPAPPIRVVSTNGAGDCLSACILYSLILGNNLEASIPYGLAGASLALMSEQTVPDMLNESMLKACLSEIPKT